MRTRADRGLVHLYIGNGKGKTTAAVGLCVRCAGAGRRVLLTQFLKGRPTAELGPLRQIGVEIERTDPVVKFYRAMDETERAACVSSCRELFRRAGEALAGGDYGLVVLDEALDAVNLGILREEELCRALDGRAGSTEVVLTGRDPGEDICRRADYITEMLPLRHPYEEGIAAREGIEY